MSVVQLETAMEQDYCHFLGELIEEAKQSKDPEEIAFILNLWDNENDWATVQERAACEGSTWYVWWMDGVRKYMQLELQALAEPAENET